MFADRFSISPPIIIIGNFLAVARACRRFYTPTLPAERPNRQDHFGVNGVGLVDSAYFSRLGMPASKEAGV